MNDPTNELTQWNPMLPDVRVPQKQLMRPLGRLEFISMLHQYAMDKQGQMHLYAVLSLTLNVQRAELLKESCQPLTPKAERAYDRLTEHYMATIESITHHASAEILGELRTVPPAFNQGFVAGLALFES